MQSVQSPGAERFHPDNLVRCLVMVHDEDQCAVDGA